MAIIDLGKVITTVDSALSATSENPIQNKVIKGALDGKLSDAPSDNKKYVRQNGAWVEGGGSEITVDTSLSSTSTNPVQNKAVQAALLDKVDKVSGKSLSTNDFTDAYKTKLEGIEAGATKCAAVDSTLSSTSSNPVQNKVIYTEIENLRTAIKTQPISSFEVDMTDGCVYVEQKDSSAYTFSIDSEGNLIME